MYYYTFHGFKNLVKVTTEGGIKVIKNNDHRELVQ